MLVWGVVWGVGVVGGGGGMLIGPCNPMVRYFRARRSGLQGSDTYFLTNAVMDLQDWASNVTGPSFGGTVTIGAHEGRGFEHCFNGYLPDGTVAPNGITRELYVTKFVPRMAERWAQSAPEGANMGWHEY